MKKFFFTLFAVVCLFTLSSNAFAQSSPLPDHPIPTTETFVKGKVLEIVKQETREAGGYKTLVQTIKIQILEGAEKDKIITIERGSDYRVSVNDLISKDQIVVIDVLSQKGQPTTYSIADSYRLDKLLYLTLAFFVLTVLFTGKRGIGALTGLLISLSVIILFIVPQILQQRDPLLISLIGSLAILLITTYLAHGFSKQTTLAISSTLLSLIVACIFSLLAVQIAHLVGLGTEDSFLLEISPNARINPKGLLLGGIIIGTLGALNDVTTTQAATIFALHKQNPKLKFLELAEHSFGIGQQHILSLVNTLVLAYAGTSLPIFIFFVLNPAHLPAWVIINNQSTAEEIVRTLAGSMGLILAVPITTFLASWFAIKIKRAEISRVLQ